MSGAGSALRTYARALPRDPVLDFREFAHANPEVMWKLLQHVVAQLQPAAAPAPV
jgi:hypothetical protein